MVVKADAPNPGSVEAVRLSCTCPVLDNRHGHGVPTDNGPIFWMADSCPIHGPAAREVTKHG